MQPLVLTDFAIMSGVPDRGAVSYTAFCQRDSVRALTVDAEGGTPVGCVACPAGYRSHGGSDHACLSCEGVQCASEGQDTFVVPVNAAGIQVCRST